MSLTKDEMLIKAVMDARYVEFIYKKDQTLRTIEPYAYYYDIKNQLKVWAYQPKRLNGGSGGPRSFLVDNMTYLRLEGEFKRREMDDAPMINFPIAVHF